jgi:PilZ domain
MSVIRSGNSTTENSPWPTDMNLPDPIGKQVEERRSTSRYNLILLVEIRVARNMAAAGTVLAETQDMSTHGFYFNIAQKFTVGTQFEFSFTLPVDITGAIQVNISGKARAVRVEETGESHSGWLGVAAIIESYEVSRAEFVKP